jgi:nicotinamide-nucleotide amidase
MRAEIIAVGSELLQSSRLDTNSLFITSRLNSLGIDVAKKSVVGDRESEIGQTLTSALKDSEIIVITGGLGPTNDDLTREAVSAILGRDLHISEDIIASLKKRYRSFGLKLTPNNRRQAAVPERGEIIPNPRGTAPGILLREGKCLIFLLPGPPRELESMVDNHVVPLIKSTKPVQELHSRLLKVASEAESKVDARIEGIYKAYKDIETTILSSPGVITLQFFWRGEADTALAESQLDALVVEIKGEMGLSVFSDREESLTEVLGTLLKARSLSLATAESCTGGLIGKLLTDVSGSSEYFLGSVVCYANSVKQGVLGVDEESLLKYGAVSEVVAGKMAEGVRKIMSADIGLSVTGIAGPGGGTVDKPVGTIYLGLSYEDLLKTRRLMLPGDRDIIRLRTSNMALDWVRREVM